MKIKWRRLNDNRGSAIVAALMILVLLTIIGFAATNMSTTELSISTNSLLYERAFYTAEAGLQHAKETLRVPFVDKNQLQISVGGSGTWTFALNGSMDGYAAAADDPNDNLDGVPVVYWIQEDNLEGVKYSVRIWDNDDGDGDLTQDSDGLIFVRSDAWEPVRGGRSSIQELVRGTSTGGLTSGYTAQEGAGSGKIYISNDAEVITDFSQQM